MRTFTVIFLIVTLAVFVLTVLLERKLIPILKSHKVGQVILEIGPRWHKHKEGTPTMGGIGFILPVMIAMLGFFLYTAVRGVSSSYIPLAVTLAFAIGNGAIGFVDDYCKLIKKQNEGLTAKQKLFLQIVMAVAYVTVMGYTGNMETTLKIPFTDWTCDLGWGWYPVAVLLLVGVVNGANLTDGIDGLASSVVFVIGGFFALLAFSRRDLQISMIGAVLLGASLGFLVYNFHPAKVFMGDTGSLFFGALVIGGSFVAKAPLIGILLSGVFIIEMLSSFLQTGFFKLTRKLCGKGKRIFRMAPLHHHFEKGGWNEYRIVAVFSFAELLFCIAAWFAR
ncbi:MAG: phospho-N-acetylmuramoyl-pentapeptide-transferase [Ruminococcaceae bacterium]|nr:phospho-N-acetylmuramoyl-pentapeptide-transferase [Oscillospiraceae bacterium]